MLIVEIKRLVIVVDRRHIGVGKNIAQNIPLAALTRFNLAIDFPQPAALPFFLIFPFVWKADAGFAFDVVEPGIFNARPRGPDVFAGDGTGMTTDAFVQIQHHADLSADVSDFLDRRFRYISHYAFSC